MISWDAIAAAIGAATQSRFQVAHAAPASGGCINQAWRIEGRDGARYFVKLNSADKLAMFEAEQVGLAAITTTQTVRVPQPITSGICSEHAFLALEYLDLCSNGNEHLQGEQLAALHRIQARQFGFARDNTLGDTQQKNSWASDWITFWKEQRLGFQLDLAVHNGYSCSLQALGVRLLEKLPELLDGYTPSPSLLHGDLWGGNHAFLTDGTPVLFDPAPYYGDRETDLAMTELFGGFGPEFYAAYRSAWPLDAGYATRKSLYNLYHVLNHANLFGGGYVQQAESMMKRLL